MEIKRVIYLTNTNWIFDENKKTVKWGEVLLDNIEEEKKKYFKYILDDKSKAWTWWMLSKLKCSFEVLKFRVEESIIANSKKWLSCLENKDNSTHFVVK